MLATAAEHQNAQARRAESAALLAGREWDRIGEDFDVGWRRVGHRLALVVASAQVGAARDGVAHIGSALISAGQHVEAQGRIDPRAFAGIASDGRSLDQLLYGAVVRARSAKVDSFAQRLTIGRNWLDMAVRTQVADAGRDAASAAIVARPRVSWVRVVSAPCCQRCAVLAGRVYRYSQGFQRHPRCNCTMLPQTVANPDAVGLTIGPGDVKDLTARQRQMIADGADFNKVINDYQRKRGAFLPPTRVQRRIAKAGSREKAMDALAEIGIFI